MNSKAILLATTVLSIALSASAVADSYYFRSKGGPTATAPEPAATANISIASTAYRAASPISGVLASSLPNPSWSFVQTPVSPSLDLVANGASLTATAPAVGTPTTFAFEAVASNAGKTAVSNSVSFTVYPLLSASGGPSGQINGKVGEAFPGQPNYVLDGVIGSVSYALLQSDAPLSNFSSLCPGLSFSSANGKLSGTSTGICSLANLSVQVQDSFDAAVIVRGPFSISVTRPVVPGAQSFTTQGNYNFTVPYYNTLTVTLKAGGGGGGGTSTLVGLVGDTGTSGGSSSVAALNLQANGGTGGRGANGLADSRGASGSPGTGSGGDTNTTGGGALGGAGGILSSSNTQGGTGGNGGRVIKTFTPNTPGAPLPGSSLAVTVGVSGKGGNGVGNSGYGYGNPGLNGGIGSIAFSWN